MAQVTAFSRFFPNSSSIYSNTTSGFNLLMTARRISRQLGPLLLLAVLAMCAPHGANAQSAQTNTLPHHLAPVPQPAGQKQFLSYWTTEAGWNTELVLRNNLETQPLTVVPAVRSSAGDETVLPSVTIQPGDVTSIDLFETLLKSAPQLAGSWGSLVLRFTAAAHRALYAYAMVRATARPIIFHLDATERGSTYETGSREGIWWLPWETTTGFLILTNTGDQEIQTVLTLTDSGGSIWQQSIPLDARQSQRLSMRYLIEQSGMTGSYGGINIRLTKGARFLSAVHLLFEASGTFSAILKMFNHNPATTLSSRSFGGVSQWTTRAPMLALINPDPALGIPEGTTLQPKLFIRNATAKTYTAHLQFNWRSPTTTGQSAPLDLPFKPNETQMVDVAELQTQKFLPSDATWASVIISAPVQPNELLAVAASYDSTGRYGAQTPFSDQLASDWEGGKWEVDANHDSLVTIANGSNQPALAQLTILYNEGAGLYQIEKPLAPGQQMAVDFADLIRNAIPDKSGNVLPSTLTSGTYRLLDLNDNPQGSLYEGKEIVDKTWGHATYTCMVCCGPETPWMQFYPLDLLIDTGDYQAVQAMNSCTGRLVTVTNVFPTWWTDNTSIATASGHLINGVGVGSTNHNARSINMYWGPKEDDPDCPLSQEVPSAPTNVRAVPTNFQVEEWTDAGGGDLHVVWSWQSSSGNLADLSPCSVSESVTYPGTGDYAWPTPFPAITSQNPTTGSVPGSDGEVADDHDLAGRLDTDFRKPYYSNSFVAHQTISYSCTVGGDTLNGTLLSAAPVTRSVNQNVNGSWKFTVTETGPAGDMTAIINPLP
ncbi:MAG: hypothetical protein WCE61_05420 [Candidatus Acidiferrum sp.]